MLKPRPIPKPKKTKKSASSKNPMPKLDYKKQQSPLAVDQIAPLPNQHKDLCIVVDIGEQKPWFVTRKELQAMEDGERKFIQHDLSKKGFWVKRANLKSKKCDYTIEGYEDEIGVERKGVSDFFSYIGKERTRTDSEKIPVLMAMNFAAIIVEENEGNILSPYQDYSTMNPNHVRGFIRSANIKGIHTYFSADVRECERRCFHWLSYWYSKKMEELKSSERLFK